MQSEITVEILCDKETLFNVLRQKGFFFKDTLKITDYYYTHIDPNGCVDFQALLKNSILIRDVELDRRYFNPNSNTAVLLYKKKAFDKYGKVISEQKVACDILNTANANEILTLAGLNCWCVKKITGHPFRRGNLHILVQEVEGLGLFMEIEQFEGQAGTTEDEILDELVDIVNDLGIPVGNDYHVSIALRLHLKKTDKMMVKFYPGLVLR